MKLNLNKVEDEGHAWQSPTPLERMVIWLGYKARSMMVRRGPAHEIEGSNAGNVAKVGEGLILEGKSKVSLRSIMVARENWSRDGS